MKMAILPFLKLHVSAIKLLGHMGKIGFEMLLRILIERWVMGFPNLTWITYMCLSSSRSQYISLCIDLGFWARANCWLRP